MEGTSIGWFMGGLIVVGIIAVIYFGWKMFGQKIKDKLGR